MSRVMRKFDIDGLVDQEAVNLGAFILKVTASRALCASQLRHIRADLYAQR